VTGPLRRLWDDQAEAWAAWARAPDHDTFWHFTRWRLFEILPEPGGLTVDLGGGEGRLARELTARGHRVVGIDGSETLVHLAVTHDEATPAVVGDLAAACMANIRSIYRGR
jgi:2-polyprenyl-3-methyl-5-hydroxy-6-metoxy-1,4-benzoquinol methylase